MTTPTKTLPRDLTGMVFSRLTVLGMAARSRGYVTYWDCQCSCGLSVVVVVVVVVDRYSLLSGNTKSCGCIKRERGAAFCATHGHDIKKHGCARRRNQTREYVAWSSMRSRCFCQSSFAWKDYGGRGITCCPEWNDFATFLRDMGECPLGLTLDRIDNDKGYFAANCRWADRSTQQKNRRKRTHCLKGHELTPENTILVKGGRSCATCTRARGLAWYYRKKDRQKNEAAA